MKTGTLACLERLARLHPKRIDLTLDRIAMLLDRLGNPQDSIGPAIHIAGTNGKGSSLSFLQAMAEAAGYVVHRYSSPHLVRFHERIILCGKPISDDGLQTVLDKVEHVNQGQPITFFEITTAAAYLAFCEHKADIVLIETGLGGRVDATNILPTRILSLITPISMDHQEFLGDNLAAIAREKAGIIAPKVPVIIGRQPAQASAVLQEIAAQRQSPASIHGRDFKLRRNRNGTVDLLQNDMPAFTLPAPSLPGRHQFDNAALAAMAGFHLARCGFDRLDAPSIARGISQASWPARLQKLDLEHPIAHAVGPHCTIWVDGGHNPAAALALRDFIVDARKPGQRYAMIVAMLKNKDACQYLAAFKGCIEYLVATTIDDHQCYKPDELVEIAASHTIPAEEAEDLFAALARIKSWSGKDKTCLIICGSLYLAGQVLSAAS
ncbi:MAG: folylpolyglutamate synthase/dihydrofolate synthase family protein [Pseudomonadota bacterium]